MKLVERHVINKNHKLWGICDELCFKAKNLYNYALYLENKSLEENGKIIQYNDLERKLKLENQFDYRNLPNNSSQQILQLLLTNFKSYFRAIKEWKKDKTKFKSCPKLPRYKHKTKGRFICIFTYVQFRVKNGLIYLPKKSGLGKLKTKVNKNNVIKQVRVVPQNSCYVVEVIYEKQERQYINNNNYLSVDLGINNLATCVDNITNKPLIINGKPLKSTNQYYNKKKANIQSQLEKNHKRKTSKKLQKLTLKRNNKINDYLHKTSKIIINHCLENNITNIVIGKNNGWKQEVNLGKRNNQNFIQIPFDKLIQQITYKGLLNGISVLLNEESYTSKCSSLDLEPIKKHENYIGKRVKRGLFQGSKQLINADVNGALNILRKATSDSLVKEIISRGLVMNPIKIKCL